MATMFRYTPEQTDALPVSFIEFSKYLKQLEYDKQTREMKRK
jgi:hypothetical protein